MKKGGKGGANTNRGGLEFENKTDFAAFIQKDLGDKYTLIPYEFKSPIIKSTSSVYEIFRNSNLEKPIGYITKQFQFYNGLMSLYGLRNVNHKQWKPDEVFFNLETNTVFIVEKKWQQGPGSVDEKIFGFVNKRRLYQNDFNQSPDEPKPTVEFCALFNSSWWLYGNDNKNAKNYQDYFDNLRIDGIRIFFDTYDYWWFGLEDPIENPHHTRGSSKQQL